LFPVAVFTVAVAVVLFQPAKKDGVPHPSRGLYRAKGGNEYTQPTAFAFAVAFLVCHPRRGSAVVFAAVFVIAVAVALLPLQSFGRCF
jgi:hypothetical protein